MRLSLLSPKRNITFITILAWNITHGMVFITFVIFVYQKQNLAFFYCYHWAQVLMTETFKPLPILCSILFQMWFLACGPVSVSDDIPIVTPAWSYILLMQRLLAIKPIALLPQSNREIYKKLNIISLSGEILRI